MGTRMLQRRGTAAEWTAQNPVLADGEIGYERDTKVLKIGDGATAWTALVSAWQTMLPINAAGVGLTIKGKPAQAGNLQEWKDDPGNVKAWVSPAGDIGSRGSIQAWGYSTHGTSIRLGGTGTAITSINTGAAGNEAVAIQLVAAQAADVLNIKDSTGAQITRITSAGGIHARFSDGSRTTALPGTGSSMSQGAVNNWGLVVKKFAAAVTDVFGVLDENNGIMFSVRADGLSGNAANGNYFNAAATNGAVMLTNSKAVGQVGHIVRAFAGQTADIQQWQDSTNATLAKIAKDGDTQVPLFSVGGTRLAGVLASFLSNATGTVPVAIKAFAGQTGDLQQWQDNTGVAQTKITSGGAIISVSASGHQLGVGAPTSGRLNVAAAGGGATIGVVVLAHATQSVDMEQYQNNAGTALLAIDKAGHLSGRGPAPTAAAQAALGTTPPAPTVVGSDQGCTISFGTGTTPATGWMLRLNFNRAYSGMGAVALTPGNPATAALGIPYVVNQGVSNIDIGFPNAPAASQAVGTYKLDVVVIGN